MKKSKSAERRREGGSRSQVQQAFPATRNVVVTKMSPQDGIALADMRNTVGQSPVHGEIWRLREEARLLVVLGNAIAEDKTIWCADDRTGERVDPPVAELCFVERRDLKVTLLKCQQWAREGNSDAAWWCAWYFEGTNHPKSVWYYIAALRRNPRQHAWALGRICSDAFEGCMCEGVPEPDLRFLTGVDEFRQIADGARLVSDISWGDWEAAVRNAESAIHLPAQ